MLIIILGGKKVSTGTKAQEIKSIQLPVTENRPKPEGFGSSSASEVFTGDEESADSIEVII